VDDRNEPAATLLYHGGAASARGNAAKRRDEYIILLYLIGFRRTNDFRISRKSVKSGGFSVKKTFHHEGFAVTDSFTGGREHFASEATRAYNHQIFHGWGFVY
jgi:hypothetical protein